MYECTFVVIATVVVMWVEPTWYDRQTRLQNRVCLPDVDRIKQQRGLNKKFSIVINKSKQTECVENFGLTADRNNNNNGGWSLIGL